jgi:hypothetical protein
MYDLGGETNGKLIVHFKLSHSAGNEFVDQRIRPIVLCPATLLESGGKISSLIKLYKTLTEGYRFLWMYIKVDKKFIVSLSQHGERRIHWEIGPCTWHMYRFMYLWQCKGLDV